MTDDLSPDEKQATAFTAAKAGYILFGQHYEYPSGSRIRAADCMGKRWPAIGENGFERCASEGKYPGMLTDIIITLWLGTVKHSSELTKDEVKAGAWTVEKACLIPARALEAAEAWATENHIILNDGPAYLEAYAVYWDIIKHERAVTFVVDVDGAKTEPEQTENLV
jgi:hypothetical protein